MVRVECDDCENKTDRIYDKNNPTMLCGNKWCTKSGSGLLKDFCIFMIEIHGSNKQLLIAVEELGELQKELLKKVNRGASNRQQIVEEFADVQIMLTQIKIIFGITDNELETAISNKIEKIERYKKVR
jgi:NTP pyrophosphatase (non-canonical NTP hydrolase)